MLRSLVFRIICVALAPGSPLGGWKGKGAIKWTRLSCRTFAANAVRLQLHALAYNLGNFLRTLATPEPIKDWSLSSLREKLIKIGAKVISHSRTVAFQMAEVSGVIGAAGVPGICGFPEKSRKREPVKVPPTVHAFGNGLPAPSPKWRETTMATSCRSQWKQATHLVRLRRLGAEIATPIPDQFWPRVGRRNAIVRPSMNGIGYSTIFQ
jgi:hypothetical protein